MTSPPNIDDRCIEDRISAMLNGDAARVVAPAHAWAEMRNGLPRQRRRAPWAVIGDAIEGSWIPLNVTIAYRAGGAVIVVAAALLLVLFLNTDDGAKVDESAPASPSESAQDAEQAIVETMADDTPPNIDPKLVDRSQVASFLVGISGTSGAYMDGLSRGRGTNSVFHLIGVGDIAEGLLAWFAILDQAAQSLGEITVPEGVAPGQGIKSYGLGLLQSHRDWAEAARADLVAGDFVDPVLLLNDAEGLFRSDEVQEWLGMRDALRESYEIAPGEIPKACFGYAGPYEVCF